MNFQFFLQSRVNKLNLDNFNFIDKDLEQLKDFPNLISLNLNCCNEITNEGLKYLKELPNLTSLDLRWCKGITKKGLEYFKDLPNFTLETNLK